METIIKIRANKSDYDVRDSAFSSISVGDVISILEQFPRDAKIVCSINYDSVFGRLKSTSFQKVEVETYQEELEKERQEEQEEIKELINTIKNKVNNNNGEMVLALHGITLETICDEKSDNLIVTELTTKMGGSLYGNTNWGLINLEETISNICDWYTLDEIVDEL